MILEVFEKKTNQTPPAVIAAATVVGTGHMRHDHKAQRKPLAS